MAIFEVGQGMGVSARLGGEWGWRLPRTSESVPQARTRARERMRALGQCDDATETAALLVTEMASNALQHGGGHWWWCQVQHQPDREQILLRALNHLPVVRRPRTPHPADMDARAAAGPAGLAEGGRGLLLVAALAKEWNIQTGRSSCLIWAALPIGPAAVLPR